MYKSAMMQALRLLGRKPMILLLIIPVSILPVLNLVILPDFKMMDLYNMMNMSFTDTDMSSLQLYNLTSTLVSSVVLLFSAISAFLLLPPAMSLLASGAAGEETPSGWYMQGLRQHWWKPTVSSLITGAVQSVLAVGFYIVFMVVMVFVMMGLSLGAPQAAGPDIDVMAMVPMIVIITVGVVLILQALMMLVNALFGLFLPALSDRSFGAAFKLIFSRKGFRKFPKLLGGFILISLVPSIFYTALGAVYILATGLPEDGMALLTSLIHYVKSVPGIIAYLLTAVFSVLPYAFQFSVYQQVKDEEAQALIKS